MDGKEQAIEDNAAELCVVMTDGQQHRYARTDRSQHLLDGRTAQVFDWHGRYYGPT